MISMRQNIVLSAVLLIAVAIGIQSCKDEQSPGYEYMPDMYRSPSVETYAETELTADGKSALHPAPNSIPRGHEPYPYPNTNEGYEMAGKNLENPIPFSDEVLDEGKELYGKFCVHCHGKTGEGDGTVPTNSDYPPPPSYKSSLKDLPAGKIFHTMMYGKNLMGSHASQISQKDRWKLVYYVQSLQDADRFDKMYRGGGEEGKAAADSTATAMNETEPDTTASNN